VAGLIAEKAPDVIGLQEVALWKQAPATLTALGPVCPGPASFTATVDYLTTLQAKLVAAGHPYRAVVWNSNFNGTLPISLTTCASFTDRDVILVRSDLPASMLSVGDTASGTYEAGMIVPLNGQPLSVPRGWSWADVTVGRKTFRFFDTHLEAYANGVRDAQAQELTEVMAESPHPVVAVGDFNTTPSEQSGAYGVLAGSGLVDSWPEAMGTAPGYTSGQSDDLDNVPSRISHRIDLIWHSAGLGTLRAVKGSGDVVGDAEADMTATDPPLWPSDHAGVALAIHVAQP
jgi:endonuclease/exonuclease/phosphatase family metal-dependent hydrolase